MFYCEIDENLRLILPHKQHAAELLALVRANLDELKPWMPWASDDYSETSALLYINQNLLDFATIGNFSASLVERGRIVGQVGFHNYDAVNRHTELGYWLAKDAQGRGLMTRAVRALVDYLFGEFDLNRVQINCNVENTKSRAIPERLGFTLEGIRRQAEYHQGRFGDWAVYAMLKEDWRK